MLVQSADFRPQTRPQEPQLLLLGSEQTTNPPLLLDSIPPLFVATVSKHSNIGIPDRSPIPLPTVLITIRYPISLSICTVTSVHMRYGCTAAVIAAFIATVRINATKGDVDIGIIDGHVAVALKQRLLSLRHIAFNTASRFSRSECSTDKFIRFEDSPYGKSTDL